MFAMARKKLSIRRKESRKWREPPEKALRFENVIVRSTNLSVEQIEEAKKLLGDALQLCGIENEIASFLKRKFDDLYGGHWQCIVGRNFGSHLDPAQFVHFTVSKISVILFR
uniref:Dynein light chain n=1 Tax=Caenorhabditis japonica TaxID=281687 RepID=A0A8R1HSH0_CAEJA